MPCTNVASSPNGFTAGGGMGIGRLGGEDIIHKRKFRFLFFITYCNGSKHVPAFFVKTAGRPSITIEATEINFLNEKTWIPGKATWEEITVTYYDIATKDNIELFSWLASIYDFTDDTCRWMNARRSDYAGQGNLIMLDGCGNALESWAMGDMWPTSIKFGDLDMASSDVCEIDITLRYSKVSYFNYCGPQVDRCPCTPCGPAGGGTAAPAGATVNATR